MKHFTCWTLRLMRLLTRWIWCHGWKTLVELCRLNTFHSWGTLLCLEMRSASCFSRVKTWCWYWRTLTDFATFEASTMGVISLGQGQGPKAVVMMKLHESDSDEYGQYSMASETRSWIRSTVHWATALRDYMPKSRFAALHGPLRYCTRHMYDSIYEGFYYQVVSRSIWTVDSWQLACRLMKSRACCIPSNVVWEGQNHGCGSSQKGHMGSSAELPPLQEAWLTLFSLFNAATYTDTDAPPSVLFGTFLSGASLALLKTMWST